MPMRAEVLGATKALRVLEALDDGVAKTLRKELRDAGDLIRKDAIKLVPDGNALTNWGGWNVTRSRGAATLSRDLGFSGPVVRRGIKTRVQRDKFGRQGGSIAVFVQNMTPAGAIFELAGKVNPSSPFAKGLRQTGYAFTGWPRILGPAWRSNVDQARRQVSDAIDRLIRETNRALEQGGVIGG